MTMRMTSRGHTAVAISLLMFDHVLVARRIGEPLTARPPAPRNNVPEAMA